MLHILSFVENHACPLCTLQFGPSLFRLHPHFSALQYLSLTRDCAFHLLTHPHHLFLTPLYILLPPTPLTPHILTFRTFTPHTPSQGPEHCNTCRNYYIEEILVAGSLVRMCVEGCPLGTYLNISNQCVPCHSGCRKDVGCAGPLPYVNRTHGCLECDRVQLDMEGNQVSECGHSASVTH